MGSLASVSHVVVMFGFLITDVGRLTPDMVAKSISLIYYLYVKVSDRAFINFLLNIFPIMVWTTVSLTWQPMDF